MVAEDDEPMVDVAGEAPEQKNGEDRGHWVDGRRHERWKIGR